MDIIDSYARTKERERKQKLSDEFVLAKVLALDISSLFGEKPEFVEPWDFYPQMFEKDKEYLKPLSNKIVLDSYINEHLRQNVPSTHLISYKDKKYSVPPEYRL